MHYAATLDSRAVKVLDAVATGRILVVDDDRSFGGFMLAALESRGHYVDWAGCIQDGLASLYAARYDLVIIDWCLPDGTGVQLLRDATDEGLLRDSAAIILTGHDFDEPDDIRVFRKPFDLEPFLDRMALIVGQTQKRRTSGAGGPRRSSGFSGSSARDGGRPANPAPKIELVLYTSQASEKCLKAIRTVRSVLEQYDIKQVNFKICDLSTHTPNGEDDSVVFTPTLVKRGPGPRTWIIGNLDQPDLLIDLLDMSGVNRRRD
jgi:CheY-like chemotaxis protein